MRDIRQKECPFVTGAAIKDAEKFWGRQKEKRRLLSAINKMESISIIGERRIGKTSLACQIRNELNKYSKDLILICLDGQSSAFISFKYFFEAIIRQVGTPCYEYCDDYYDNIVAFENYIKDQSNVVIIIDEFDRLTSKDEASGFGEQFYNSLRHLGTFRYLSMVTVSCMSLVDICKHVIGVSSPFYNIFFQIRLKDFKKHEARSFLSFNCDEGYLTGRDVKFILENVKGYTHPLKLQLSCKYIFLNDSKYDESLLTEIDTDFNEVVDHKKVKEKRRMRKKQYNSDEKEIGRVVDLIISIVTPSICIALIMYIYGFTIKTLNPIQSILVAFVATVSSFIILIFSAGFTKFIGQTTFFRLFKQLIDKVDFLSTFSDKIINSSHRLKDKSKQNI